MTRACFGRQIMSQLIKARPNPCSDRRGQRDLQKLSISRRSSSHSAAPWERTSSISSLGGRARSRENGARARRLRPHFEDITEQLLDQRRASVGRAPGSLTNQHQLSSISPSGAAAAALFRRVTSYPHLRTTDRLVRMLGPTPDCRRISSFARMPRRLFARKPHEIPAGSFSHEVAHRYAFRSTRPIRRDPGVRPP